MSEERDWVEFKDGTRWYAKPYERPCICIEGVQQCAHHAPPPPAKEKAVSVVDRIAEVLRLHPSPEGCSWCHDDRQQYALPCCRGADDHAAHLAERIAAELRPDVDEVAEAMADANEIIFGLLMPEEAEFYRCMARAAIAVAGWPAAEEKP